MLTPLMFWTLIAPSVPIREGKQGATKSPMKQRRRRSYVHNNMQTERKTDKDGGLVEVSWSRRELALQGS